MKIPVTMKDTAVIVGTLEIDETKLPGGISYVFSPCFMCESADYVKDQGGYDESKAKLIGLMVIDDKDYRPIKDVP